MERSTQNLENHVRTVPLYHFVLGALVVANLAYAGARLRHFSMGVLFEFFVAAALALFFWYVRAFPITVQDRVIRLEMRLRLHALAPDLAARLDALGVRQVTALRFAGDDEVVGLTREVLEGKLVSPADIKRRIQHWKADDLRV